MEMFFSVFMELVTCRFLENWWYFFFLLFKIQQGPLKISSVAEVMKESKQPVTKSPISKPEAVPPAEEKEGNLTQCHAEGNKGAHVLLFCTPHSRLK